MVAVTRLAREAARPFGALGLVAGDPAYRPFFLAFLSIGVAGGLWLPFVGLWLVQRLGATPPQVGWYFSAMFASAALGNLVIPAAADRLQRRRLVVVGLLLAVVPAVVALAFARTYWQATAASAVLWGAVPVFGILLASVGDIARAREAAGEPPQAGRAIAGVQVAMTLGNVAAPVAGGWLYQQTGDLTLPLLVGLLPHLGMCWIVWRYVPDDELVAARPRAPHTGQPALTVPGVDGRDGFPPAQWLWLAPLLLFLVAKGVFAFAQARVSFEPLFAAGELGASATQVGLLVTLLSLLTLVATPLLAPLIDRLGGGSTTVLAWSLAGAQGLLLSRAGAYWQMAALLPLTAAAGGIGQTSETVYAQQLAAGRRATAAATGWLNAAAFGGSALGGPLAGHLAEVGGYRLVFVLGGATNLLAAATLLSLLVLWRLARRGTAAPIAVPQPAAT